MKKKIQIEDEKWEEMAPYLSQIEKKNPFEVPKGYFDELPSIIQEVCVKSQKKSIWLEIFIFIKNPRFSISFGVLVLIAVMLFQYFPDKSVQNMAVVSISAKDISESELLATVDENTLIESLPELEPQTLNLKAEIEDYLIDNNVDISGVEGNL